MPAKGQKQSRLCRVCGETEPTKFQARLATLCGKCRQARYKKSIERCTIKTRALEKAEAMAHYGPSGQVCCSWAGCQISDIDMLVLDHIADDGAAQRRALGGGSRGKGHELYRHLKRDGYPAGYQTLCCNHNHKKELLRSRSHRKVTY
jgi:hypothetical protein